jgi:hypothetical protein
LQKQRIGMSSNLFRCLFGGPISRGPLPEVQESSWVEWEETVAAWNESEAETSQVAHAVHPVPQPDEVGWAVWEQAVQEPDLS